MRVECTPHLIIHRQMNLKEPIKRLCVRVHHEHIFHEIWKAPNEATLYGEAGVLASRACQVLFNSWRLGLEAYPQRLHVNLRVFELNETTGNDAQNVRC